MPRLKYLLDTHALVWAAADEDRLSPKAAKAIVATPYEQLGISDVTLQEIGLLVHRGRIEFRRSTKDVLGSILEHVIVIPISMEIALKAPALALPHGDQFDRIICATAIQNGVPLITKDSAIADAGIVDVVW